MATTRLQNKSVITNEDSLTNVSTNHPTTVLKGLNPRIGPKNRCSEDARKKVQNLLNKNVKKIEINEKRVLPIGHISGSVAMQKDRGELNNCSCSKG